MIADSVPWKEELLRVAKRLQVKKAQQRWTERSGFLVERDIMVSAYAIRRLIEAWKVSDRLVKEPIRVRQHKLIGDVPDLWTRYSYWELFDMEASTTIELSLQEVCNQIIHSWMWSFSADEHTELFDGIYVASDRRRSSVLYFIPIDQLIHTFRAVGSEDIVDKALTRGTDGQWYPLWIRAEEDSELSGERRLSFVAHPDASPYRNDD